MSFAGHKLCTNAELVRFAVLASKVRHRAWIQSVQGAVATWSVISIRYF